MALVLKERCNKSLKHRNIYYQHAILPVRLCKMPPTAAEDEMELLLFMFRLGNVFGFIVAQLLRN